MAATPDTGFLVIADLTGYTAHLGDPPVDAAQVERIRADKEAAFGRLATTVTDTFPVVGQREVRS